MTSGTALHPNPLQLSEKAEGDLSPLETLVYELFRQTADESNRISRALVTQGSKAYKRQYNTLIKEAGSNNRLLILDDSTLNTIQGRVRENANSITNTYNNDLKRAIHNTFQENPNLSKKEILVRLRTWNDTRDVWKSQQIALWNELSAQQQATEDFFKQNPTVQAMAEAFPKKAVCERCQKLVDMGVVDISVALANPFPIHPNCVHGWTIKIANKPASVESGSFWRNLISRLGF